MKHKMKRTLFIFGLLAFLTASSFSQEKDFPELKGLYDGQKPPGKTAQPFAVNIFSSNDTFLHSNIIFSHGEKETYWQQNIGDGSKFFGRDGGYPLVTPDAKYLFFMDYIAGIIEELRRTELKN